MLASGLPSRFLQKVREAETGCWTWTAHVDRHGYGRFRWHGRMALAHRVAYELLVGPIPEGLEIDHLCRNRACVNPVHMEPVTSRENTLRGDTLQAQFAARSHCANGHPFAGGNVYAREGRGRGCRACDAEYSRRYRTRQRERSAA